MPSNANRQFLDFERPIKDLIDEIERLKHTSEQKKIDYTETISKLESQILERRQEITKNLTSWQKVQLSRHPDRPYTLKYIEKMTSNFVELYGDRNVKDDKAMVGGFAMLDGETVMMIGQQKGINTKTRQLRNFGMANPEGYRKALRLMRLAEKFNKPIITLIDTPGAYPGLEAEERGQGEAIARNIYEMIRLKVPVISPENCSTILWRSWAQKEIAAEQLKLTADYMKGFGLVDDIIPEPAGGADWDYNEAAQILKSHLIPVLQDLKKIPAEERINQRIEKFGKMGFWEEM